MGFAATAVATQLRRQGLGPAEIGAFVASFYLPWAFKWAVGPFVDVFRSQRFGHRRGWILLTQIMMALTLLSLIAVPLPGNRRSRARRAPGREGLGAATIAASWQGVAIEAWGYPVTLLIDAIAGPLCVLLLPTMKREATFTDTLAEGRARKLALALGLCCLAWLPYWANHELLGSGQPIAGTFFTLIFIASALFLLAGREVLGKGAGAWHRVALWAAPLLLAMHGRYYVDRLGALPSLRSCAVLPLFGGVVLLGLASQNWRTLGVEPQPV